MRTILVLIRKEFLQIKRNRTLLPIIFVMPLVQLLMLSYAADLNLKRINYSYLDLDQSSQSQQLLAHYESSPFFQLQEVLQDEEDVGRELKTGDSGLVIKIPADFEADLTYHQPVGVQFLVDGINNAAAVMTAAYAQNILIDYQKELAQGSGQDLQTRGIEITFRHWYNPGLEFKVYMVPGILVLLVTLIAWILAALNIVREKEMGTIEQINVTPIRKYQFIAGKLIPFWLIALFELALGLGLGKLIFDIPIVGNIGLLFMFTSIYLLAPLGIGLLISSLSSNQQQVMFLTFFFVMTFILMSGLFTPIESMPKWANYINYLNPLAYFMPVIRMILMKGSGFHEILPYFAGISIYSVIVLFLATWAYRKRA